MTKAEAFTKLPKPRRRFKYIAKIKITTKCGLTDQQKLHVDFWPFDTFKAHILDVEEL